MTYRISQRMLGVQSPMIPVVGEMVKRHPGTISLGQGVVRWGPPEVVAEAVGKAASSDARVFKYSLAFGMDSILEAVRAKVERENLMRVDGERRVVVTAGSNMGFVNAVLAVADVGDEVIVLSPFYFNHEMAIEMAGCKAVVVETDE